MTSQRSVPHLTRLNRRVYARATVEQLGMTSKQLAVLALLRDTGDLPQQSLCGAMQLSQNTVVAWLNELEAMGLIERVRDADDRRKHNVHITELGRSALDDGESALRRIEDEVLSSLSDQERTQLRNLLAKALEA